MTPPQLPELKQLELQAALESYRLSLVDSSPLFGIEIATSITDHLINDIVQHTYKYTSEEDFVRYGLSRYQAIELYTNMHIS